MTPQEFTMWLHGFIQGANKHNIDPEEWSLIKHTLRTVDQKSIPKAEHMAPSYTTISGVPNGTGVTYKVTPSTNTDARTLLTETNL